MSGSTASWPTQPASVPASVWAWGSGCPWPMSEILTLLNDPTEPADTGEPRVPQRLFALKHGDTFVVADAFGDILGDGDGLFRNDTRVLSRFHLTLGGRAPSLLGAVVGQDNVLFTSNLTFRPLPPLGDASAPEDGVVHLQRRRLIWEERLHERLTLTNYAEHEAVVPLGLSFAADFRDMFEVRGTKRRARGHPLPAEVA